MRKHLIHTIIIILLAGNCGCLSDTGLPDMRENYSLRSNRPFGTMMAHKIFSGSFSENFVQNIKEPFAHTAALFEDTASVYFSVSRNLFAGSRDADAILNFVSNGNDVFFAAAGFDTAFLQRLHCNVSNESNLSDIAPASYTNTFVQSVNKGKSAIDTFGYFYKSFKNSITESELLRGEIIGYSEEGKPNCRLYFLGKGKLVLHTDPRAFSNYFLLKGENHLYLQHIISLLNPSPQHVFWDDYYNHVNYRKDESSNSNILPEILKFPALNAAFWLLLCVFLLYVLFGGKRKQRMIREIKPNVNSSVEFTKTIARLYLQQHNNKNIAEKMVTYFYDFIRSSYYLNTHNFSSEFIMALSRKSGITEDKTRAAFKAIDGVLLSNEITDYQLLSLHKHIQQFYKK